MQAKRLAQHRKRIRSVSNTPEKTEGFFLSPCRHAGDMFFHFGGFHVGGRKKTSHLSVTGLFLTLAVSV
jgi:hypothetical protein